MFPAALIPPPAPGRFVSMPFKRLVILKLCLLGVSLSFAPSLWASDPAADREYFETRVRPLLDQRCHECHSAKAKKLKGGLRLDSRSGLMAGGESGPVISPGDPSASTLIQAVGYHNVDLQMPPKAKLPDVEIAVLTEWVRRGAYWPLETTPGSAAADNGTPGFDLAARKSTHWMWQPIARPQMPKIIGSDWPRSDIDRFILASLKEAGLKPAADADRRALLRRLYFDLIGLPPEPERIEDFLADASPQAVEKVVDRLLASPQFGERWARHWMDLVRYAETFGHEFDIEFKNAWHYRDYLIRAFNDDLPYDRFVAEHIAGDLIASPRRNPVDHFNESIRATAFWFFHEQTHAPVDVRQHQADRIDNQIDVMSKTFLAATVACARCHDHKFDAIGTRDYYGLAGYLSSSRFQRYWLDDGTLDKAAAELDSLARQGDAIMAGAGILPAAPQSILPPPGPGDVVFETFDAPDYRGWYLAGWAFGGGPTQAGMWAPSSDSSQVYRSGLACSGRLGSALGGSLRSRSFLITHKQIHVLAAGKGQVRLVVDGYTLDELKPLLFAGLIQKVDSPDGFKWVTIAGDLQKYLGHRAYLEILDDNDQFIAVDEIRFSDQAAPERIPDSIYRSTAPLDDSASSNLQRIHQRLQAINQSLPKPATIPAMADGSGVDEPIFIRGSYKKPGEPAPRQFLQAIAGFKQPPPPADHSGRLDLARRVVDPSNPLTSRVIVNRLWHHLMGRGIVATVDDFGKLGAAPTHPQLLDFLARKFMQEGWSIKSMIRAIVLSRVYAQSSRGDERADEKDPANLLWHKAAVRRLEGEAIRDSMLAISGRLDAKMYGPPVPVYLTEFMDGRGRPKDSGPLDGDGRRSVYLEVRRNFLPPMMLAFDTPIPFSTVGRRSVSNVPAQALILMNDPLAARLAELWARRSLAAGPMPMEQRVGRLYLEAFGRPPGETERGEALAFLKARGKPADDPRLWADFCHVLWNVKDFVFLH